MCWLLMPQPNKPPHRRLTLEESLLHLVLEPGLTGGILDCELRFYDFAGTEATGADAD